MQDFIRNENIKLYRTALATCTDEHKRKVLVALLRVLASEEAVSTRPERPEHRQSS
jgi:hypothetical protein